MKKLVLICTLAAFAAVPALSQTPGPSPSPEKREVKPGAGEWDKKIKDELKLTDEQVVKYDALSKEYGEKIEAVLKDANLTKEVQKEKKMALKAEKETKLFEFLTAEQQAKYKELKEEMKKKQEAKPEQKQGT